MKKASDLRIPFKWEERRPILLERLLYLPGQYDRHEEWEILPWSNQEIFGNNHPVMIEYCSGNGQWICERAKEHPHINWVAVDIRFDRSRKTWLRLHREKLTNLYVCCGDALTFTLHYIPRKSVSEIFINFPDPWPKLRHAKHRLIQASFLQEIAAIARDSCKCTLVTDDAGYVGEILHQFAACPKWQPLLPPPYFLLDPPHYGTSFFFDLWKKKGRNIHLMQYICN